MINIIKKFTFSSIFVVFLMVFTFVAVDSCTEKKTTDNGAGIPDPPTGISLEDFSDWSSTDWIVFIHSHVDSIDTLTSGLYLIKSDGSEMRLLLEQTVLLSYPAFSPDGQWISFSQDGQICKISFDGAQIDTLTEKEYYFPSSWSPDGSQIAYELRPGDNRGIWIMDSDGNNSELRIPYAHDPDWSYSDSIIYVNFDGIHSSGAICIADTSGSAIRIIFDVSDNFVPVGNIPELHRESSIIVFNPQVPGEMQDIWLVNLDGTNLRRVTDFSATFPSFSPDGSRIVYTDNRDGHLWTMNLDGSNKIKVTGIQ